MKKAAIILSKLIASLILVVLFLLGLVYIQTTIYSFPAPAPFSGDSLLNPYQSIDYNLDKKTIKCNFHAHTIAWKGVTNGHDTPQNLTEAYKKQGYTVAGISNYHCIEQSDNSNSIIYIPVYEHGINIFKSHKLGIDARKPSYFDYPLFQNTSQKQQIINDIRNNGGLVAIAHPMFVNGHTLEDMAQLTNYQFVEVLNHYRVSDEYWDAALTAGRLVYGIGNDDTHDINNEPTFRMWTEVFADTATKEGVLDALVKGKSYAVHAYEGNADISLDSIFVKGDTVFYAIAGSVDSVLAFGAGHKQIAGQKAAKGYFLLPNHSPYMRLVAKSKNCALYFNPIVRSVNGKTSGVERRLPSIKLPATWFYRMCVFVVEVLVLLAFLYIWKIKPFKR